MSIDTSSTVIIAGWYPDPADDKQARWWDGTQWSSSIRPRQPAAPQHENRYFSPVAVRTDATLPPIDPYRPMNRRHDSQGFVSMGVKTSISFQPTRAYTGAVWALATMPLWVTVIVVTLVLALGNLYSTFLVSLTSVVTFVVAVLFAIHDHKVLLNSLHPKAASAWWILLSPMVYLIVRGVHVSRNVGHGWAPLIVYLLCSFVPVAAVLAFSSLFHFFASLLGGS